MGVDFGFRGGPTYRPTTRNEMFQSALDLPMNQGATFFDQAKGGVLESFGLGTAIKDTFIPEGNTARDYRALSFPLVGPAYEATRAVVQSVINKPEPSLTEEQFKASPYHRDEIPYEPGMTEDRAAVLADWHDARKVREYFATKRPITSFVGNLAGQAIDPVNYLPVLGPLVKAGAVGRFGKIFGGAITGALDASSNTAIAALATQEVRGKAGDDVSWQSTVSQIATAALIGSVFGTIGGAVEKRADAKFRATTEERLSTLRTTQEARVALNEAIGAVVRGEDIRLSPNSTEPMARVARDVVSDQGIDVYHGTAASFDQFDLSKAGTGEGTAEEGFGVYVAQVADVAKSYHRLLAGQSTPERDVYSHWLSEAGGNRTKAAEMAAAFGKETGQDMSGVVDRLRNPEGNVYKIKMLADPAKMVDLEKPYSAQTPEVQAALDATLGPSEPDRMFTGKDFPKDVARKLEASGVPGTSFLDSFSKANGGGTRNFVVFNPKNLRKERDILSDVRTSPVDNSPARPDALPNGIKEATAAIAKPDDIKAIAAQYRVDPETGSYFEQPDIKQLDTEGRLTAGDKAELEAAQAAYEDGAAYGEALKAAVGCII